MKIVKREDKEHFLKILKKYDLEDFIGFSKTVKVLYVDRDTGLREDFYGVFKIFFYDIDIASNGQEALELFNKNKYDLIITALDIEKLNGVELISKIRQISRHITILVLSSKEKYFIELIRLGIDGYILNPIEVEQFVVIMQKVLETLQNKQALYEYRIELEAKNEELGRLNENLELEVKRELAKNREKDIRLFEQAKMAALGEMIGNIAHQWRQPLSIISTAATGIEIQKEFDSLTNEIFEESIEKIKESVVYLSNTIDIFSDLIKEKRTVRKVILQERIKTVIDLVKDSLKSENIRLLENIADSGPIELELPFGKIAQVLINILENAKDILLEQKIKEPWIKLGLEQSDKITITVEDNGGGIPPDIKDKIFEPYFTTKHQARGTGLGLYLSYIITTEDLNGKLFVKNTINGAKFFIELDKKEED